MSRLKDLFKKVCQCADSGRTGRSEGTAGGSSAQRTGRTLGKMSKVRRPFI